MTGYDEAAAWLSLNAPDWQLYRSDTVLVPAGLVGGPTGLRVTVELARPDYDDSVSLRGEGETILAAVRNAIGGQP